MEVDLQRTHVYYFQPRWIIINAAFANASQSPCYHLDRSAILNVISD